MTEKVPAAAEAPAANDVPPLVTNPPLAADSETLLLEMHEMLAKQAKWLKAVYNIYYQDE